MTVAVVITAATLLAGCGPDRTRLDLVINDSDGTVRQHFTDFTRASYSRSDDGTIELALQASNPSTRDPTQSITEIVLLKELWNPIPGTTYVERTQINAHVQYGVLSPPTGLRYDGSAFITYKISERTGVLTGKIESGRLGLRYRMGDATEPFGAARLSGEFRATRDPGFVIETAQKLDTLFSK